MARMADLLAFQFDVILQIHKSKSIGPTDLRFSFVI